jgi:hypothetical protein
MALAAALGLGLGLPSRLGPSAPLVIAAGPDRRRQSLARRHDAKFVRGVSVFSNAGRCLPEEGCMRAIYAASLAAAAIGFCATGLSAAPAGFGAQQNATPLVHLAQAWVYDDYYRRGYRPACPFGYHYACRVGPNGYRHCACWPNW